MLLVLTMLPAPGLQSAYADEPAARPATTGGDAALEGYSAESAAAAVQREDGTLAADGLVYAATDGGLALVGFDGLPEGEGAVKEVSVPAAVAVDGKDAAVVAVDIAEAQVAESVVALTLPQSVNKVNTAALAAAFPALASVEVVAPKASSAPVAAGAAAMRAAYSSFGGVLYKNNREASEGDEPAVLAKELVWAPPATVVARIPAECTSIAPGAFADCADLKTVVCFGVMENIPLAQKSEDGTVTPGAFTDEQIQTVNVIVPQTGTVVPDGEHVSASVAVTDDSTMDVKREAWWKSGFASDRITLGEVCGSTTNTLPVTEEGVLEVAEAEVAYAPETTQNSSSRKAGIEPPESAIPTPVPDDDSVDPSESGLVFTHLADMTLSVSWKGDPTATPTYLDIPAYATINGVTYPVTEIAPEAFKGAVFLTGITIPETVKTIGEGAFGGCDNLSEAGLPFESKEALEMASIGASSTMSSPKGDEENQSTASQSHHLGDMASFNDLNEERDDFSTHDGSASTAVSTEGDISPYWSGNGTMWIDCPQGTDKLDFQYDPGHFVFTISAYTVTITMKDNWKYQFVRSGHNSLDGFVIETNILNPDGSKNKVSNIIARPKSGYIITGMDSTCVLNGANSTEPESFWIQTAPSAITSAASHLTQATANGLYAALNHNHDSRYYTESEVNNLLNGKAASSHTHDDRYYTESEMNTKLNAKLDSSAISTYNTNAKLDAKFNAKLDSSAVSNYNTNAKLDAKFNTKVDASDFGTIAYNGLDGTDTSVFPTSYRKGGTPALPTPEKAGSEFLGWTWSRGGASGDSSDLADAFAEAGTVTLSANWGAPKASCFFSGAPLDATSGGTHVIRVAVPDAGRAISSAKLKKVDGSGLVIGGRESQLSFALGATSAAAAGSPMTSWSGGDNAWSVNLGSGLTLTEAADGGSHWLYVGINIPASAIDANSVVKSYAPGDYVASLVTLEYELA